MFDRNAEPPLGDGQTQPCRRPIIVCGCTARHMHRMAEHNRDANVHIYQTRHWKLKQPCGTWPAFLASCCHMSCLLQAGSRRSILTTGLFRGAATGRSPCRLSSDRSTTWTGRSPEATSANLRNDRSRRGRTGALGPELTYATPNWLPETGPSSIQPESHFFKTSGKTSPIVSLLHLAVTQHQS